MTAAPPLWKHQEQSLKLFEAQPRGYDWSSPGTGKTRVQIERYRRRKKPRGRWLIICPKTLMESAWLDDIEKYAPELTVALATAENRESAFRMNTDVVIINTDGIKFFDDKIKQRYLQTFDHVTIDEFTYFKHPTSKRSKVMSKIRKFFKFRYLMSGTPNPISVMELWHPTLILDDGERLGDNYYKLRSVMQEPKQIGPMPEHVEWNDKPGAAQVVDNALADITIRHAFEEVMTHVPPNHRHTVDFTMSKKSRKVYDTVERDAIAMLEDGRTLTAVHAASLRNKLLQIASGAVYNDAMDEERGYSIIDTTRYEMIAEMIEEREHSVVFFNWRHQREVMIELLRKMKISATYIDGSVNKKGERVQIVRDFQAGKYQAVLLHPATGAHGLTLTRGDTTIFSSPFYQADLMEQAIHRIYRGEQNKVTNTMFVRATGTVEELVYEKLFTRAFNMNDLLDLIRDRHK